MRRGGLHACNGQLFVLVSSTATMEVLPTVWGLLVATADPQTAPPLVMRVSRCLDDGTSDAWVRMTQIRTIASSALDPVPAGTVPPDVMADLDRVLAQLAGLD